MEQVVRRERLQSRKCQEPGGELTAAQLHTVDIDQLAVSLNELGVELERGQKRGLGDAQAIAPQVDAASEKASLRGLPMVGGNASEIREGSLGGVILGGTKSASARARIASISRSGAPNRRHAQRRATPPKAANKPARRQGGRVDSPAGPRSTAPGRSASVFWMGSVAMIGYTRSFAAKVPSRRFRTVRSDLLQTESARDGTLNLSKLAGDRLPYD